MTDNINPDHYKTGPFECIQLTSLLSSDWGNVVKYAYRWQHKNGLEDLKKADWYINHALEHNIPFFAAWNKEHEDMIEQSAIEFLETLYGADWAGLALFWNALKWGYFTDARETLEDKIAQVEKEGE